MVFDCTVDRRIPGGLFSREPRPDAVLKWLLIWLLIRAPPWIGSRAAWHGSRPQPPQQERTTRQGGCLDAEGSGNSHAYTRTPPARTGDLRAAAVRRVGYL
jgi:hypothetical protein